MVNPKPAQAFTRIIMHACELVFGFLIRFIVIDYQTELRELEFLDEVQKVSRSKSFGVDEGVLSAEGL